VNISKAEYSRRRKNLMAMMEPNSIALVPAARECTRSRDTEYTFRQDSDFLYLTGFDEPDGVLVLIPGRRAGQVVLFCRDRDPEMELWNGYRAGPEGAVAEFGMDDAFPIDDIDDILPGLLEGKQHIYYSMGHNDDFDRRVMGWVNHIRRQIRTGAKPPGDFTDLAFLLHEQRLFKTAQELKIMRKP
jgi:Xaa-Pro aminopeptidase